MMNKIVSGVIIASVFAEMFGKERKENKQQSEDDPSFLDDLSSLELMQMYDDLTSSDGFLFPLELSEFDAIGFGLYSGMTPLEFSAFDAVDFRNSFYTSLEEFKKQDPFHPIATREKDGAPLVRSNETFDGEKILWDLYIEQFPRSKRRSKYTSLDKEVIEGETRFVEFWLGSYDYRSQEIMKQVEVPSMDSFLHYHDGSILSQLWEISKTKECSKDPFKGCTRPHPDYWEALNNLRAELKPHYESFIKGILDEASSVISFPRSEFHTYFEGGRDLPLSEVRKVLSQIPMGAPLIDGDSYYDVDTYSVWVRVDGNPDIRNIAEADVRQRIFRTMPGIESHPSYEDLVEAHVDYLVGQKDTYLNFQQDFKIFRSDQGDVHFSTSVAQALADRDLTRYRIFYKGLDEFDPDYKPDYNETVQDLLQSYGNSLHLYLPSVPKIFRAQRTSLTEKYYQAKNISIAERTRDDFLDALAHLVENRLIGRESYFDKKWKDAEGVLYSNPISRGYKYPLIWVMSDPFTVEKSPLRISEDRLKKIQRLDLRRVDYCGRVVHPIL